MWRVTTEFQQTRIKSLQCDRAHVEIGRPWTWTCEDLKKNCGGIVSFLAVLLHGEMIWLPVE